MESKPKSIELAEFKEELLPSGRKLLHCIFKQKFGTFRYIWMPPWKGEFGVERLFFKALEIEEWNDYEGVWSKELRQAAQEIPSIEEIRLPVKIQVGGVEEFPDDGIVPGTYSVAVEVLSDEEQAWTEKREFGPFISIGKVKISWLSLKSFLTKQVKTIIAVSDDIEDATECVGWNGWGDCTRCEDIGVRFHVLLESGLDKAEYEVIGREIVSHTRSFIRKRLSDYQALKRGFEEL